ncbi:MAG: hypothetical protein FJ125_11335 [Deltaproteobacteria bacterium]|nr:hypothetical protein [Deltaproteobacteria bacterium]
MSGEVPAPHSTGVDESCLAVMRYCQSLMPLAQDAQKPMFLLKPAVGAIGAHLSAVHRCRADFQRLVEATLARVKVWAKGEIAAEAVAGR